MSIRYTYKCNECDLVHYEWRTVAQRHYQAICPKCGEPTKKIIDPPVVLIDGSLHGACPGAEMKWEADRARRKEKEVENVKEHGDGNEFKNLITV